MEKAVIGIIGCGNIFTMHATSAHHLKNAEIVGVCDIKKDRADKAAKKYNCKAYYDYKEMINKDNIDVVTLSQVPLLPLAYIQLHPLCILELYSDNNNFANQVCPLHFP